MEWMYLAFASSFGWTRLAVLVADVLIEKRTKSLALFS